MTTLIQNGRIIDPSQNMDCVANLVISDGQIVCITQDLPQCDRIIDAAGCIVCPGFIDMHAHEDPLSEIPHSDASVDNLACLLRMGVTTALTGNCGDNFVDPLEFLAAAEANGTYVNVALLAGYTFYREQFSRSDRYTPASAEERSRILLALQKALDGGCFGVSFGLEYVPGMDHEELSGAASLCTPSGKMISAHIRTCAEQVLSGAAEIMDIGKSAGIFTEISHIGSMAAYGQMQELLALVERYRAQGTRVSCDCYPYTAFSTTIGSAPYDDLDLIHCSYEDIEMCEGAYLGMRCTKEIFEKERAEHPEYLTVGHVMREEEIRTALRNPDVTVGSDCFLNHGNGHPRAAGAFPRFLGKYVREEKLLPLSEAIRKITLLPAQLLGLSSKGRLAPGCDADIVIFSYDHVCDNSTFTQPTLVPSGICYVLLSGEIAVQDGHILHGNLGRPLYS